MIRQAKRVLELIKENHSIDEIQNELALSNREFSDVLKYLKDYGYNFSKTYHSDGKIIIKLNKTLNFNDNKKTRIVVKDKILKSIFISDLHIGSIYERPDLLRKVYEYASSHDIHIIFNCGDVIEGIYPDSPTPLLNTTLSSQLKKVLRVYPEYPGITNFILYGNHDYHSMQEEGIDVSRILETKRYDLVSLGYGESTILLKDDAISIVHNLKKSQTQQVNSDVAITFKGHSHKSKNSFKEEKKIFVPTLSDDTTGPYEFRPLPCFLEAEFFFYDKKIERINLRQLAIVNKEIRLANEEAIVLRKVPRTKRSYIPSQK